MARVPHGIAADTLKLTVRLRFLLSDHVAQVLTGFALLKRAGIIDLRIDWWRRSAPLPDLVEARVDGLTLAYDMIDASYAWSREYAESVDLYFKRSHDSAAPVAANARPFGLNYGVRAERELYLTRPLARLRRESGDATRLAPLEAFEGAPRRPAGQPRVIFLTRAWDPAGESDEEFDAQSEGPAREAFNEHRAECIRLLRKELGSGFTGGFVFSDHALARYPDLVLGPEHTDQPNYVRYLHEADIGVTTVGLRGSNPWKVGEYVAAAKAVVSHPLRYAVPGPFAADRNYVTFDTADECVTAVAALIDEPELLHAMKLENWRYYHQWLRPDRLVLNTLLTAFDELT